MAGTYAISDGTKLVKALEKLGGNKDGTLRAGYLESATYPDGTPVAFVALIQDAGAPKAGIPPRPFFRNMVAAKSPNWPVSVANLLKLHDYDTEKVLNLMGAGIVGQLRQSVIDLVAPPLSPVTLMLRRMRADNPDLVVNATVVAQARARVAAGEVASGVSTKPLVDSPAAHLINSAAFEVVMS